MRNYAQQVGDKFKQLSERYTNIPADIISNSCEWFVADGSYIYKMTGRDFLYYLELTDNMFWLED